MITPIFTTRIEPVLATLPGNLLSARIVKRLPQGELTVRPIDLDDLDLELAFLESLSPNSRYQRMLGTVNFKSLDRVRELLDYPMGPAIAIGAIINDGRLDSQGKSLAQLIGVARYAATSDSGVAEMAIVMADRFQGHGLGGLLLDRLHEIARAAGYREINALTFATNQAMLKLAERAGYSARPEPGDGTLCRISKPLVIGEENAEVAEMVSSQDPKASGAMADRYFDAAITAMFD